MTVPQKKVREAVLYALFTDHFFEESDKDGLISLLMEQLEMSKKNVKDAVARASFILEKFPSLDEKLKPHIEGYDFERVSFLEKTILRLASYEIFFDNSIPEVVAIAEAVRLCRKFSTPEGAKFINGVLDAMYKHNLHLLPTKECDKVNV